MELFLIGRVDASIRKIELESAVAPSGRGDKRLTFLRKAKA